jgi:hypothetical protein
MRRRKEERRLTKREEGINTIQQSKQQKCC